MSWPLKSKRRAEELRPRPSQSRDKTHPTYQTCRSTHETMTLQDMKVAESSGLQLLAAAPATELSVSLLVLFSGARVHYLGPPGPSTSQILGTFSRFSEDFLGRERGGGP